MNPNKTVVILVGKADTMEGTNVARPDEVQLTLFSHMKSQGELLNSDLLLETPVGVMARSAIQKVSNNLTPLIHVSVNSRFYNCHEL